MQQLVQHHDIDTGAAVAKMAGGGGLVVWYGMTLNEWVAVLTIAYFLLQIGLLLPKYYKMIIGWLKK